MSCRHGVNGPVWCDMQWNMYDKSCCVMYGLYGMCEMCCHHNIQAVER